MARLNGVPVTDELLQELRTRRAAIVEILQREQTPPTTQTPPLASRFFGGLSERMEAGRRSPDESFPLAEARRLVDTVRGAGLTIALVEEDGRVSIRGTGKLDEQIASRCPEQKSAIVRLRAQEQQSAEGGA